MDSLDLTIVRRLMEHGRTTWSELATMLGLSAPAAADRVRRLEERSVIRGYGAHIAPEALGLELTAFVSVTLERPRDRAAFLARVQALPEILECHHAAGDDDYLLKVRCANPRALDRVISAEIKDVPGVVRTRTMIVLSTEKETTVLPLPAGDDDGR